VIRQFLSTIEEVRELGAERFYLGKSGLEVK